MPSYVRVISGGTLCVGLKQVHGRTWKVEFLFKNLQQKVIRDQSLDKNNLAMNRVSIDGKRLTWRMLHNVVIPLHIQVISLSYRSHLGSKSDIKATKF